MKLEALELTLCSHISLLRIMVYAESPPGSM